MTDQLRIDAHVHSLYSDGQYSPEELQRLAIAADLNGFVITDHDTIDAYSNHLKVDANAISGVELSTVVFGKTVHLLGYGFNPQSMSIQQACVFNQEARIKRNEGLYEAIFQTFNLKMHDEDVLEYFERIWKIQIKQIGTHHIIMTLASKGKGSGHAINIYKKYMGRKGKLYVPAHWISFDEGVRAIHEAGGKAVLAHPHIVKDLKRVEKLIKHGLDGLEVYYKSYNTLQHQMYLKIVDKYNLFATGGSDFHSDSYRQDVIGSAWIERSSFLENLGID